jgi:hypothetical protein
MRRLLPVLTLVLLVAAPTASAKPGHPPGEIPTQARWLSVPDGTATGGTWMARVLVLGRQGGRPVVAVKDLASGRRQSFKTSGADGRWQAAVAFPRAGRYGVEVVGWDPARPDRAHTIGPPVTIGRPSATSVELQDTGIPWWPFGLAALAVAAVALVARARPGAR